MDDCYGKSLRRDTNIRLLSGQRIPILRTECCPLKLRAIFQREITSSVSFLLPFTWLLSPLLQQPCLFLGDFVAICGAIGFTPLDFVIPAVAYLKAGRMPKNTKLHLSVKVLNFPIACWFSVVAVLGCVGAVRFIIEGIKTYKVLS